jgi:hypothetical protein
MTSSLIRTATIVVAAVAFAACDSRQENARENNLERKADNLEDAADVVRTQAEKTADAVERNDAGLNSSTTEKTADAVREAGERKADALEDQADIEREKK